MDPPKKYYRMPAWIWKLPPRILNGEDKRFLAFIWWCGFETCHCHNWYLQKKFGFSRRMIQYRIAKLKALKLISVGCPGSWMRTIFPRRITNPQHWLFIMSGFSSRIIYSKLPKKVSLKGATFCTHSKTPTELNPGRKEP